MSCPNHTIGTELVVTIRPQDIEAVEVTLNGKELPVNIEGTGPEYTVTVAAADIDATGSLEIKEGSNVLECRTVVE